MRFPFARRLVGLSMVLLAIFSARVGDSSSGNGLAVAGEAMGGILTLIGVTSLSKDISSCSPSTPSTCAKTALDTLEIAGGAVALAAGISANKDTSDSGTTLATSGSSYSWSSGSGLTGDNSAATIADQCAQAAPLCTCTGSTTCVPQITLPSLATLQGLVGSGLGINQTGNPNGQSLQAALNDLATNYPQAQQAVAAFNAAAQNGTLGGTDNIAAQPDTVTNKTKAPDTTHSSAPAAAIAAKLDAEDGDSMDLTKLMEKAKEERGNFVPPTVSGLDVIDPATGKTLSIWERLTATIRGQHNRDILLAKLEWTRNKVLNQVKTQMVVNKAKE